MQRPPYSPKESLLSRGVGRHIVLIGPIIGFLLLSLGYLQWKLLDLPNLLRINDEALRIALLTDPRVLKWGTLMFTALGLMQVGRAFSSRSFFEPFWKQPFSTNKVLLGMIFTVIAVLMLVVYTPGVQTFFHVVGLSGSNLGLCIAFALIVLVIMEMVKAFERRNSAAS